MTVLLIIALIAIGVLTLIVFGLLRTHADILRALHRAGIPLDDTAATSAVGPVPVSAPNRNQSAIDVSGTVPGGGPVSISVGAAQQTLLAFLSSGCKTCATFWSQLASPLIEIGGETTRLVIVAQDPAHDSESRLVELAPDGVRTVCSSAAWEAYGVPGSPYFVLIDGRNRKVVGSGTATNWPQVPSTPRSGHRRRQIRHCPSRPVLNRTVALPRMVLMPNWPHTASVPGIRRCTRPRSPRPTRPMVTREPVRCGACGRAARSCARRLVSLRNFDAHQHHSAR